jgi:hypothetical protein
MRTFALRPDAPDELLTARHRCLSALRRVIAISAFKPRVLIGLQHPAGAGISVRPFARSQRRFRHHCEVNVPGLHLRFHIRKLCESVRSPAPSLRSVSRPNRGDLYARNPLSASISNVPDLSPVSTPLQVLFRRPSGSKRSTGPISGSPPYRTFDSFLLPAASSFDSTAVAALNQHETRFVQLTDRSVNPGTESIIVKAWSAVKQNNDVSKCFQQVFPGLFFNRLRMTAVDSLWINRHSKNLFEGTPPPNPTVVFRGLVEISQPWWRTPSGVVFAII